jgi:hypothetical protein
MRRFLVLPLLAAVALAGCGKEEKAPGSGGESAGLSPDQAAAKASALVTPKPGLYKTTAEIIDLSFPGMPEGMAGQMRKSMTANFGSTDCLTEADSKDAVKNMAKGDTQGNCTYTKYDVSGGKIDAVMSCGSKENGGTFVMKGTVGADGVDMTMEGNQKSQGMPGSGMHMKMHLKSSRIGECKTS